MEAVDGPDDLAILVAHRPYLSQLVKDAKLITGDILTPVATVM